jgi:hypothetical protein
MMLAVLVIYYIAEARAGFANIDQGFWGFALKFVFMNIPWLVAPVVSLPFAAKQLAYLYRSTADVHAERPNMAANLSRSTI